MKDDLLIHTFGFLDAILKTKENLIQNDEDERLYIKCRWLIMRGLSVYPDVVPIINIVNFKSMVPKVEFLFLQNIIASKNRMKMKWPKRSPKSVYLQAVREYYGYNEMKAEQAMKLLSIEQLTKIEETIQREDSWTFSKDSVSKSK